MPAQRERRPMAGFFKFTAVGQMAAGVVAAHRTTADNPLGWFQLDRAVVRESRKATPALYTGACVGISADIAAQVEGAKEIGNILMIEFVDTERVKKGTKKIFRVSQLNSAELAKLCAGADDKRPDVYQSPQEPDANQLNMDVSDDDSDGDDDELAF